MTTWWVAEPCRPLFDVAHSGPLVEAWSRIRLPLEPVDSIRSFQRTLRASVPIDGSPQLRSAAVVRREVLSSAGALDAVQPNIKRKQ